MCNSEAAVGPVCTYKSDFKVQIGAVLGQLTMSQLRFVTDVVERLSHSWQRSVTLPGLRAKVCLQWTVCCVDLTPALC